MIDVKTKIHDNFSIEFKIGFSGRRSIRNNDFVINSWIFVPNSLDINRLTYKKDQFYKDVKSNVRLITPVFLLRDIASGEAIPINNLKNSFGKMASSMTRTNVSDYEFQIKMFGAIFKSAVRNESEYIRQKINAGSTELCDKYVENIRHIFKSYRNLWSIIDVPTVDERIKSKYAFADEYISHVAHYYSVRIINTLNASTAPDKDEKTKLLTDLLIEEYEYKEKKGYSHTILDDKANNRNLVLRQGLLKKYIESALYLKVNTKQDGKAIEQISFGLAAGMAMMVSTLIALPFQKYLGNYPALIFIILIVAYMLKDRLKDLTRMAFAHKLKNQYYDNKNVIGIKNVTIGWVKEGMDFITDDKTPREVLQIRNRSDLEADNNLLDEKIILYRKRVFIDNEKLKGNYTYNFTGINDIIRFHINRFTQKMDNPNLMITGITDDKQLKTIETQKVYTLYFVLQFRYEDQLEYKGFKITACRDGIIDITPQ